MEPIEIIRREMTGVTLAAFEADKPKIWIVERGIEIISEASRRHVVHENLPPLEEVCGNELLQEKGR